MAGLTSEAYSEMVERMGESAVEEAREGIDPEEVEYDEAIDAIRSAASELVDGWLTDRAPAVMGQVVALSGDNPEKHVDWQWKICHEPGYDTPEDVLRLLAHQCMTADVAGPHIDRLREEW